VIWFVFVSFPPLDVEKRKHRMSSLHNIYGGGAMYYTVPTILLPDTCCVDALLALSTLFSVLENAVEVFFPSSSVIAPMIAPMSATAGVSEKVYVRLIWRHEYEGMMFSPENLLQRLQIKDIYLQLGLDYTNDPLFKDALGLTLVY
jgi:hypothetical protein